MIDFRSDTVTTPTEKMKQAMFHASVGDDVFMEDPTVNALEKKAAAMFQMDAALFCPSGTMTNQIAIQCHTTPGGEVLTGGTAHIYHYEGGGVAKNAGCTTNLLPGNRGLFAASTLKNAIKKDDVHFPKSQLIALENTSNKGGGAVWNTQDIKAIRAIAQEHNLPMHLDGARLFNALIATNDSPQEHGSLFESISICLSKGLGCPVGSLLLGSSSFIHKARRVRKVMGGGMRQAGFLAAAGIYALDHHIERIKLDHQRAKKLAEVCSQLPYVTHCEGAETNIVLFELKAGIDSVSFINTLKAHGVLAVSMGGSLIRLVTHLQIDDADVDTCIKVLKSIKPA